MKNLKEFKALIKRYESITLEEIKEAFDKQEWYDIPANYLTGFGAGCTLCAAGLCSDCVYGLWTPCFSGDNMKTFDRISDADTPLKLFNAYRARAKHMKTLI